MNYLFYFYKNLIIKLFIKLKLIFKLYSNYSMTLQNNFILFLHPHLERGLDII